ncbi:MAG: YitT family protein [Bacteroidales bacterium]|nr:YitT family protein [Bacteroidales bacterium]
MSKKVYSLLKDYLVITVAILIYSVGWSVFILPHSLVTGGVAGISAIIQYATGFNISYSYAILNAILLLLGIKYLGKGFGAKTIYAVALISLCFRIIPEWIPQEFIQAVSIDNGKLLSAIFGGVICGFGMSMMMAVGGSSGGTDIVGLMVSNKYNISTGRVLLFLDIVIIASSLIIPEESGWGARFATVIFGYVIAGVETFTIDHMLQLSRQSVQLFIFSKNYEKIANRVMQESERGVSVISAKGWYSKDDIQVVMVVAKKSQINQLLSIIKQEDPNAFTSIGSVAGVYGEGFDRIKIR